MIFDCINHVKRTPLFSGFADEPLTGEDVLGHDVVHEDGTPLPENLKAVWIDTETGLTKVIDTEEFVSCAMRKEEPPVRAYPRRCQLVKKPLTDNEQEYAKRISEVMSASHKAQS